MLILSVLGLVIVAGAFGAWIASGGQNWAVSPKEYPYSNLYDPTGEKTYLWQNEEYLKRHSRH